MMYRLLTLTILTFSFSSCADTEIRKPAEPQQAEKSDDPQIEKQPEARYQLIGLVNGPSEYDPTTSFEIIALKEGMKILDSEPKQYDSSYVFTFLDQHIAGRKLYLTQNGHESGAVSYRDPGRYYPNEISDAMVSVNVDVKQTAKRDSGISQLITTWKPEPQYDLPRNSTKAEEAIALNKARSLLAKHNDMKHLIPGLTFDAGQTICDGELIAASIKSVDTVRYDVLSIFLLLDSKTGEVRFVRDCSGGEVEHYYTQYIGQIDLDDDGQDEIILFSQYYEWSDYTFLKRSGKTWKEIFRGGGNGV
jgi:hypothetical protein